MALNFARYLAQQIAGGAQSLIYMLAWLMASSLDY
jgi:hypothetical protein